MNELAGKKVWVLEDIHRYGTDITVHATMDGAKDRARVIIDEVDWSDLPEEEMKRDLRRANALIDAWAEDEPQDQRAFYTGDGGEQWRLVVTPAVIED